MSTQGQVSTQEQAASPLDQAEQWIGRMRQVLNAGGALDPTLAQLVSAYAIRDQQVQAVARLVEQLGEAVADARSQAQPAPAEGAAPSAPKGSGAAQNTAG